MQNTTDRKVLVTGGCGYIGSILVPKLTSDYRVVVLDKMYFGNHLPPSPNLESIDGDIRDEKLLSQIMPGITDIIHLAAISNDPSSELDPELTYSTNRDAIKSLVKIAKSNGVTRFINASSSSVYGVKEEESVTEDLSLEPITLYAQLKAESEKIVGAETGPDFTTVSIRSATVCGYSPRMRFDVIVNIMAKSAIVDKKITVHGGAQHRPNIHIDDLTNLYRLMLEYPAEKISGEVFNVGSKNYTVSEIAQMTHEETGAPIEVNHNITDNRSYRISSEKINRMLGFEVAHTIRQGIRDIKEAFDAGKFPNPQDDQYYNVRTVKNALQAGTQA